MGTIAFGGFLLIAAGGLAVAGFQFAAADSVGQVPAAVRQTLAVLNHDFFFRLDGGVVVAVFATVAASLRHDAIPRWFGYLSIGGRWNHLPDPLLRGRVPRFRHLDTPLSLLSLRAAAYGS